MKWLWFSLLLLTTVGCGRDGGGGGADPVQRADGVATVRLTGSDLMKYNLTRFTVHPGERVRLELTNIGHMPLTTMGHNVVILQAGQDYRAFCGQVGAKGGSLENDYVPPSLLGQVLAHTKLAGPGQTVSVEFTAPGPGEYPFVCTFPTHFVYMNGRMVVDGGPNLH